MLEAIVKGAIAGAVYGLGKYYNKKQKSKEEYLFSNMVFKKGKFIKTLLIGACIGGAAAYLGISIEIAFANELLYFGAVVGVEELLKPVKRFLRRKGYLE